MRNEYVEWEKIEGFEDYEINNMGIVMNSGRGNFLMHTENQQGIACVHLYKGRSQYLRSVAVIVAKTFLDPPPSEIFDTPIHLDGDRMNCRALNLAWRPRWFAVMYHRQFRNFTPIVQDPFMLMDKESEETYANEFEAAMKHGLLASRVYMSACNGDPVFPTGQVFEFVNQDI